MLKPTDTDFICGYLNPSVVSSSGSQSLKLENVSRLVPLANKRQPRMPILVVQRCGRVYPSSRFFKRRKLMSRNHHVEACSLFATALSPIRGQNTSCLGFSGVNAFIITKADLLYLRFLDQGDLSPLQNNLCCFFCSG